MLIYPTYVAEHARERILEHLRWCTVRSVLRSSHFDRDIGSRKSPSLVETRAVIVVFGHGGIWKACQLVIDLRMVF